ncbi:methyltransferase domain-containing protein [Metabacillus sediminilitoris]|uniref:Methyltransferase domain-containing protein n=1 Tax=Metabacillus sediminilitoris TaxID=2567941 RepID=A0A4S4BQL8_9BACI|nr:methyltransferase domain-containing protein [Metabacillus sediminilitoris]QGQ48701.1 methyltransferase domain-containing protein [Metabacillus sediminilitoris]THF77250.1 methyltransferase domain-containing protein [Metabacillus sediminilitoris]
MVMTNTRYDYIELWKESMTDHNGNMPKRMIDDAVEEAFWSSMLEKKKQQKLDPYAQVVQREILSLLNGDDHVLEIGPGWGNYTFAIAENVKRLTCIDSSKSIVQFLESQATAKNVYNMKLIHGKWESETEIEKYNVVFGFNCYYRMYDIEKALLKMNKSAQRLAIVGMTTGPEKPHYMDLHKKGYKINLRRRDYIHILNVLYQLGIMANCKIVKLQSKKSYLSYEELIRDNTTKILDAHYNANEVEMVINRYITEKDGKFEYIYPFHAALLYWNPINL